MIKLFIHILLFGVILADLTTWKEWKKKYDKVSPLTMSRKSEQKRYEAFKANLKLIREHNKLHAKNHSSYELGLNEYSDRTENEMFETFHSKIKVNQKQQQQPILSAPFQIAARPKQAYQVYYLEGKNRLDRSDFFHFYFYSG